MFYVYTCYDELADMIMETEKSHDLLSASWKSW